MQPSPQKLRLSLVLEREQAPTWICELVERISQSEDVEVIHIAKQPARRELPAPSSLSGFLIWLQGLVERAIWTKADLTRPGLPLTLTASSGNGSPDIVLQLAPGEIDSALLAQARFGVWKPIIPTGGEDARQVAGFWELFRGQKFLRAQILYCLSEQRGWEVLVDSTTQAFPYSLTATRNLLYGKTSALIMQSLRLARVSGRLPIALDEIPIAARAEWQRATPSNLPPSAAARGLCFIKQIMGLAAEAMKRLSVRPQWSVLLARSLRGEVAFEDGVRLTPPAETMVADPHLMLENGSAYLFVEEMNFRERRGYISAYRVQADLGAVTLGPVLREPHHLSFPFVFRHGGQIYMMPEAYEARVVPLYRAIEFPMRWQLERHLLSDLHAVDSTMIEHDGRLWLFTTVSEFAPASGDLYLYSACDLAGPWLPHPMNPIRRGVFGARGAGEIFAAGGRLYRPGQDCSRHYGYAVRLFEITLLTKQEYAEREVTVIEPNIRAGNFAVHTLNCAEDIVALDCQHPRLRGFRVAPAGAQLKRSRASHEIILRHIASGHPTPLCPRTNEDG